MLFKLSFFILTFSSLAIAQIHTNPGGGLPDRHKDEEPLCLILEDEVSSSEKTFVESYRLKYSSETDFSSLLEKILIGINLRALNNPKLLGHTTIECNDGNIEALTKILKLYKRGHGPRIKCDSFEQRFYQIPVLEKIIESYAKK